MNSTYMRELTRLTLRTPAEAARVLMDLNLPERFLWTSLALMAVLNAVLYAFAVVLSPPPAGVSPILVPSPFFFLLMAVAGLFGLVWALYLVGRWMGGQGTLPEVLVLITWLQFLHVLAKVGLLILAMVTSALSMLGSMIVFVIGLWIGLHFVNEGHRLASLGKSAGVLIIAGLVTLTVVSVALSVVAVPFLGVMGDV